MSVSSLLLEPDITSILAPFVPRFPRWIPARLKLPPDTDDVATIGQAVDYAIRFELRRLDSNATTFPLVARRAVEATLPVIAPEFEPRARETLVGAERDLQAYVAMRSPTPEARRMLAGRCIQLAKLDSIYRNSRLRDDFENAEPGSIVEVARILAITPFEQLTVKKPLVLNPTFGRFSTLVGNADADMIAGDTLIDFKTTSRQEIDPGYGYQLLSYLILARKARDAGAKLPEIRRLAILFTRHGHLEEWDVSQVVRTPGFKRMESEYLHYAARVLRDRAKPGKKK